MAKGNRAMHNSLITDETHMLCHNESICGGKMQVQNSETNKSHENFFVRGMEILEQLLKPM